MIVPQSATGDVGRAAVLVPLRSLKSGKARLVEALTLGQRRQLIEVMAARVIDAAHDLDVLVVHDDPDVAVWASERGAASLRPDQPGLNNAVAAGRDHLRNFGYNRVIVAHADLPHAKDLRVMLTDHPIAIAPDRHRDGTNVMALPTAIDFSFAYGPGSFQSHVEIARTLGIEPHLIDEPGLAWDVDHPDDLPNDLSEFDLAEPDVIETPSTPTLNPRGTQP